MAKGNVCKAKRVISKAFDKPGQFISDNISDIKDSIHDSVDKITSLRQKQRSAVKSFKRKKRQLKDVYLKQSWRKRRPDITLFIEVVFAVILGVILYNIWPMLTNPAPLGYTPDQMNQAAKLSPGAFNMEEMAKVNMEVRSFGDYAQYFKSDPFSPANMGVNALNAGSAVLPFVQFFIMFVLPPFAMGYAIWFVYKFSKHVFRALWGWYLTLYSYFTKLIQGKLGCKWYIRMVTGWGCSTPKFGEYFARWRRQYVDVPVYYEKLKYLKRFYAAKKRYYEIPWYQYITLPRKRYAIKAEFAKRLYVDRAIEVFLKKLGKLHPEYYTMPKDKFFRWLQGHNRRLAGMYSKAMRAKDQIGSYRSVTKSGKQCVCPASDKVSKAIKKGNRVVDAAQMSINRLVKATNKVYDKVASATRLPTCENMDGGLEKTIKNRHDIARKILVFIVLTTLTLYIYSYLYGTPSWLKNVTSSTTQYVTQGATMVTQGKSISLPLIYLAAFSSMMVAVLFT